MCSLCVVKEMETHIENKVLLSEDMVYEMHTEAKTLDGERKA